jgi:Phosphate transporter family
LGRLSASCSQAAGFLTSGEVGVAANPPEPRVLSRLPGLQIEEDSEVNAIHRYAEVFDPRAERAFRYLQIFTAMTNSFAHGSNDVANAIGPYASIIAIYRNPTVRWPRGFDGLRWPFLPAPRKPSSLRAPLHRLLR